MWWNRGQVLLTPLPPKKEVPYFCQFCQREQSRISPLNLFNLDFFILKFATRKIKTSREDSQKQFKFQLKSSLLCNFFTWLDVFSFADVHPIRTWCRNQDIESLLANLWSPVSSSAAVVGNVYLECTQIMGWPVTAPTSSPPPWQDDTICL